MSGTCLAVTFINADVGGEVTSLRIAGSRIVAQGGDASASDLVVDLHGDRLLPGLINAHDHLHLNTLSPLESDGHYWRHAREWVAEVNLRRRTDPAFESRVAVSLDERLLIGGVKNVLSGVTTVAHHDPLYPFLAHEHFPTAVLSNYGWSHSLYIDGERQVRSDYLGTPADWPWIIHVAEGVDEDASAEFDRLDGLGCLGANTLIVHGIALECAQRKRLEATAAGLIWCPSSNLRLFGRTAEVGELVRHGCVALGTDSRFSGSRDLLCELSVAREVEALEEHALECLVTQDAARLLRLADRGALGIGYRADLLVLPYGMALSNTARADIRLVVLGGRALYADPDYARLVAPATHWAAVCVDGRPKLLERRLVAALSGAAVGEPGLKIADLTWAAA